MRRSVFKVINIVGFLFVVGGVLISYSSEDRTVGLPAVMCGIFVLVVCGLIEGLLVDLFGDGARKPANKNDSDMKGH